MPLRKITTFGFDVYSDSLTRINLNTSRTKTLLTISPNSYGISIKDSEFRAALKKSDYLVLDGVYFGLASIFLNGVTIVKNQGPQVFQHFMNLMNEQGGRVFFLGSSDEILKKIERKALVKYPHITVCYYSPPYKEKFSEKDNKEMIDAVNAFVPDIVFVGMTCPKQEKWAEQHKHLIKTKLICCIGAVFDWFAGNQKEIHPLWWKLNLGWLKRTIDRPEIIKRYPTIGIFFWHLILALLGSGKYRNGRF
jgi:N-acetylglucosaminyldiphosphoundecaprenol N-acetyl-beta-D-mannosaminyltransferase